MEEIKLVLGKYLKVSSSAITKIEEWKTVIFVAIEGIGGRFVPKSVLYKNGDKGIFKRFVKRRVQNWNLFDLKLLNAKQLQSLCILLGVSHSGTKAKAIARIKDTVKVKLIVIPFLKMRATDSSLNSAEKYELEKLQASFFANSYKSRELKSFCKMVKTFAPSTKWGMAMSLMNWLNGCLLRGQRAYQQAVKDINQKKAA